MSDEGSTDDERATLQSQFVEFAKTLEHPGAGGVDAISLYRSDYWLRQAKVLDDRRVTMTDTGVAWCKYSKTEMNWEEWNGYLTDLCEMKGLDKKSIAEALTVCGLPGSLPVHVPEYRNFFRTYKSKKCLVNVPGNDNV